MKLEDLEGGSGRGSDDENHSNDERRSFFHRNVASPSPAGMRGISRALVSPKKAAVGLKTTHVTLALVMLVLALASWETMAKLLHDVIECYTKPAFITYCVHSAYTVCLLPWVAIEKLSGRNLGDFHLLRKPVIVSAALLSVVSAAAAYFWYLSLPRTYVWANNTIYQSNPVWVYLFSIAFLGSSWDWRKVVPLVLCFSGIEIISLSSKDGVSGGATPQPTPSPSGGT